MLANCAAFAAPVSETEAREAVAGWAALGDALTGADVFGGREIAGVTTYKGADDNGAFHVVSFVGGGFAVTSGDTEVTPILAYSDGGEFVATDENPLWVLLTRDVAGRTKQLETVGENSSSSRKGGAFRSPTPTSNSNSASAWARLREAAATPVKPLAKAAAPGKESAVSDVRVAPLLKTLWNQQDVGGEHCYNYYTPSNYPCGCMATSFAQIMKYFEWPKTKVAVGDHWYTRTVNPPDASAITWRMGLDPDSGKRYDSLDPVFTGSEFEFGGPYDWANMPDDPASVTLTDEERKAIGLLTRDCGISLGMRYAPTGSDSYNSRIKLRLLDQFGYANAEFITQNSTDTEGFVAAMLSSFDFGSPCALGVTIPEGGHAIVGDGYGYTGGRLYIHFNYGWGQHASTAWYAPPEADEENGDYPTVNNIVYNIYTPGICEEAGRTIVSGRVLDEEGNPVAGQTVTAKDRKTGDTFTATSNGNGIYALLLPPETTYSVSAAKDDADAKAILRVERCVSNGIKELEGKTTRNGREKVANLPCTDLSLTTATKDDYVWLDESAATHLYSGEWSQGVEYGSSGKVYLYNNVFVPYTASTGNVVTVEATAQFCEVTNPTDPDENVQAAVRLGTNGCFQVWTKTGNGEQVTGNSWVDVAAEGVTPESGAEFTLRTTIAYTNQTYSVEVKNADEWISFNSSTPNSQLSTSSFPLATMTNRVTSIGFVGDTLFTSLLGNCRYEAIGFQPGEITVADAVVILDAAKAAWLNARGDYAAVSDRLASVTSNEFATAWLCNLDIMNVMASAKLTITSIDVGSDNVTVGVTLARTGAVEQKINGVLKFYGTSTLEAFKSGAAEPVLSQTIEDDDFSESDTTTATFPKDGNTFFTGGIE